MSRAAFCIPDRTWSQSVHSICNPNVISSVFSLEVNVRKWGMDVLRDLDSGLAIAHRVLHANPVGARGRAVSDMLSDCWWPRLQLPLETIQVGRNCGFDCDGPEMRMQAFALFAGPSNSKFTAEDVFAHLQHVSSRSNKGYQKMNKLLAFAHYEFWICFLCAQIKSTTGASSHLHLHLCGSEPLRWSRFFYQTTCQSTLKNGYNHITCGVDDYLTFRPQTASYGQYFKPELSLPPALRLGKLTEALGLVPGVVFTFKMV